VSNILILSHIEINLLMKGYILFLILVVYSLEINALNVFQAEEATIYLGIVENEHAGYTGSGYVNGDNMAGSYVEWKVSMADSGQQVLTFYFANGSTDDRPMEIRINGEVINPGLSFPGSGDWTNWQASAELNVVLNKGVNLIKATATTASGGPNLDRIELTGEVNYSIKLVTYGSGNVTADPEQDYYVPGTMVTLTAHAGECYSFQGWRGDVSAEDSILEVRVDSLVNLAAFFLRSGVYTRTDAQLGWSTYNGLTTGGTGGTEVTVSTQAELATYLSSSSKYIIRIEGTIEVEPFGYEMPVGSNTTLLGAGDDATIKGGGLSISGVNNVVVQNLHFRDAFVTFDGKTTDNDAIEINNSTHVWINHCDFSHFDDGLIDIKNAADFITVSWCRFHNHNKVMLIGASDDDTQDMGHLSVTVHHNWFDGEGGIGLHQRVPRVRFGKVHVFNNFYNKMVIRGPMAAWDADLVIENCYFRDSKDPHPVEGNGSDSKLRAQGNIYDNSSGRIDTKNAANAFDPSSFYSYELNEASDVPSLVMIGAGVRDKIEIGDSAAGPCTPVGMEAHTLKREGACREGAPGPRLDPVYPNPFHGQTNISFILNRTSAVRLELYDARGRKIETILDEICQAGENRIEFNAGMLPSGVYFCRMITPAALLTESMLLLR
jgi:pectate lyase